MEKRSTLLFIILFVVSMAYSQTITPLVVSSSGGYSLTQQGSVAWTIGEPISETYVSGTNITTMGFHQPEVLALTTLIKEQGDLQAILVYPNPVQDKLLVNFGSITNGSYKLEMVDDLGRTMLKTEAVITEPSKTVTLFLKELSNGTYYLKISKDLFIKTIKIIKVN